MQDSEGATHRDALAHAPALERYATGEAMRRASRFMPKYDPGNPNWLALLGLVILVTAFAVLEPLAFTLPCSLVLLAIAWGVVDRPRVEKHFNQLLEDRKNLSICDFAREFDPRVIDTWIVRAVYEQVQAALPTKLVVPIKATDELFVSLMLHDDDLDLDLAEQISQRTGRSLEDCESNPYLGRVTTVRDLVLFFNNQARVCTT